MFSTFIILRSLSVRLFNVQCLMRTGECGIKSSQKLVATVSKNDATQSFQFP